MKKKSKKWIIATLAIITAVVGVIVAIGAYLKKKAEVIGETLDYDADFYDDEDEFYDEDVQDDSPEYNEAASDDLGVEITDENVQESDDEIKE